MSKSNSKINLYVRLRYPKEKKISSFIPIEKIITNISRHKLNLQTIPMLIIGIVQTNLANIY